MASAEQASYALDADFRTSLTEASDSGISVGHDDLLERRIGDPLDRLAGEHGVARAGSDARRARGFDRDRSVGQRACGVDDVIDDHGLLCLRTSPTMFITSETFGAGSRLSMMARPAPRRLLKARARSTPPASGDTTTQFSPTIAEHAQLLDQHGHREQVDRTGMSKKP